MQDTSENLEQGREIHSTHPLPSLSVPMTDIANQPTNSELASPSFSMQCSQQTADEQSWLTK